MYHCTLPLALTTLVVMATMMAVLVLILQLATQECARQSTQDAMAHLLATEKARRTTGHRTHQAALAFLPRSGIRVGWVRRLVVCALLRELALWCLSWVLPVLRVGAARSNVSELLDRGFSRLDGLLLTALLLLVVIVVLAVLEATLSRWAVGLLRWVAALLLLAILTILLLTAILRSLRRLTVALLWWIALLLLAVLFLWWVATLLVLAVLLLRRVAAVLIVVGVGHCGDR